MRCFHIPLSHISGDQVSISGKELHHLINVVRLREGDEFTVLDGVGGVYEVSLISCTKDAAIGKIKERHQDQPPLVKTGLFMGLPKADKMDMVVQKATELGANLIAPVLCQRSVPKLPENRAERRIARWRQISIEASKQSRRSFFPIISDFLQFEKVLEETNPKLIFVSPTSYAAGSNRLRDALRQNKRAKEMSILIGPEGGFTEDEISRAISTGAVPVTLGENILRAETAAIAALAIVKYEMEAAYSEPDA